MKTPTIDQLAEEGVKLENYYVQPLCSPTRATIMTGRYSSHTGIGPNVDRIDYPYGVPAQEVFFPELLKAKAGYKTHMVGKWHLGACHEKYHPTFRGFDSYIGYLAGGQGYYSQVGDRNSTCDHLGHCLGPDFKYNYSSQFFAHESKRIIQNHAAATAKNDNKKNDDFNENDVTPLFLYLAFQSVHNPYDVPPIDVNATFPQIYNYKRRIYAGMITMMDDAISQIVDELVKQHMWNDTVVVFTADNGGIDVGSNYPLRGTKVYNWEGGIKAVGFVRGTNNPDLKPIPAKTSSMALMHSTDWFLTLVEGLAGIEDVYGENYDGDHDSDGEFAKITELKPSRSARRATTQSRIPLPLDGFDQWNVLTGQEDANRTTIFHQVPVVAQPVDTGAVNPKSNKTIWTTSMCMHNVDNRTYQCSPFGVTGGALRHGDYKLLITYPGPAPWGDTSSIYNAVQFLPGGRYANGSNIFVPLTPDVKPIPYLDQYFLFDISNDPTESYNLAESMPNKFHELIEIYQDYATNSAQPALDWRWGFTDPTWRHNPQISNKIRHGVTRDLDGTTTEGSSNIRTVNTERSMVEGSSSASSSNESSDAAAGDSIEHGEPASPAGTCTGPFLGSEYCSYGHEWECFVQFNDLDGYDIAEIDNITGGTIECQTLCSSHDSCLYWVLVDKKETQSQKCKLKSDRGQITPCPNCAFGPRECPR